MDIIGTIIAFFVGMLAGIPLGIWWARHTLKTDPEKMGRIVAEAKSARDRVRAEYEDRFGGPKP